MLVRDNFFFSFVTFDIYFPFTAVACSSARKYVPKGNSLIFQLLPGNTNISHDLPKSLNVYD